MNDPAGYELLDFGDGRKLERFGDLTLDRPSPAAESVRSAHPELWRTTIARYERTSGDRGIWKTIADLPQQWSVAHATVRLQLKLTEFGHVGVFPEQMENWDWIARQVASGVKRVGRPLRVLNLFAYTGGCTLAAAAAGAEVVHVDASRTTVAWARRNAALSQLADAPIRWILEDAATFVRRELTRGNRYHGVILDPPSYGHGRKGEPWKLNEHLMPLLQSVAELTEPHRVFILLSCHAPGYGPAELSACLSDAVFGSCAAGVSAGDMWLRTADGRKLHAGVTARWPGEL